MKKLFKDYGTYIAIILVSTVFLSVYYYINFYNKNAAAKNPAASIEKVEEFNSLNAGAFILKESNKNYSALENIFSSTGYDIMEGNFDKYKEITEQKFILVVPREEANKLKEKEKEYIIKNIKQGHKIITWGKSPLSEELGIEFSGKNKEVKVYLWENHKDVPITFENPINYEGFSSSLDNKKTLAVDMNGSPMAFSGKLGEGAFIYTAFALAGDNASYLNFPFIMKDIKSVFNIKPSFARDDLALYMDLGFHGSEKPSEIAERLKRYGVNQINLSTWYSKDQYKDFYKEIIDECHKRGISVFAWFEFPLVNSDFWDKHPEWREKTASGNDAHIDWRYLMALEDPKVLQAVKEYTKDFMMTFDFDGIDIAEIYFESPGKGFSGKSRFTPMHESFREGFKEKYGVDPIEAFNITSKYYWRKNSDIKQKIIDYRVELTNMLHEEFLTLCGDLKKEKPYLKSSVTVIDSIADKNMRENIGIDAKDIVKLQDKYHFMLQIEDPFTLWGLGPERYKVIGEEYRSIMEPNNLLSIDINILERGGKVYPTKKQRGLELYNLINTASRYTDKVILYALGTMEDEDMFFTPYTRNSDIKVDKISENEYKIKADKKFTLEIKTSGRIFYIDGKRWNFYSEEGVIIPGGEHSLKIEKNNKDTSSFRVETISGEIKDAFADDNSLDFSYTSDGRFYITINAKPSQIKLDGAAFNGEMEKLENKYTIFLPKGEHKVSFYK